MRLCRLGCNESDDKTDVNVVENTTLFDFDGKAIPSVDVYKHSSSSKEEVNIQTTSDEKNVKTRIENNTDSTKKVSVIVIGYDRKQCHKQCTKRVKRSKRKYGRRSFR